MDINLQTGKKMKQACQLTALAAALALAGCGGGGGGFYGSTTNSTTSGTGTSGTGTTTLVAPNSIAVSQAKATLNTGGDSVDLAFRVLDAQGGVIANAPLTFTIANQIESGASLSTASSVKTDSNGLAKVTLNLDSNTLNYRINHNIVLTATSAQAGTTINQQITIPAVGTKLSLASNVTTIVAGGSADVTATAVDGVGQPIANAVVNLLDSNQAVVGTATTNSAGLATINIPQSKVTGTAGQLTLNGQLVGTDTKLTQASTNSVTLSTPVANQSLSFLPTTSTTVKIGDTATIAVQVQSANQADLLNNPVTFATSEGVLTATSVAVTGITQNAAGLWVGTATTTLSSGSPGTASLLVNFKNNSIPGVVQIISTLPSDVTLQASVSVLAPGAHTTVLAQVRDVNGAPVSNAVVNFTITADPSGGSLSSPQAISDTNGQASITYTAGATSTLADSVKINAVATGGSPAASATANLLTLTVAQQSAFITVSQDNSIVLDPSQPTFYFKNFGDSVVDIAGNPITNQQVSIVLVPTSFSKGFWSFIPPTIITNAAGGSTTIPAHWAQTITVTCNASQFKNIPSPATLITATSASSAASATYVTDGTGVFPYKMRYGKNYASWVTISMNASTTVNTNRSVSQLSLSPLPFVATDLDPNHAFDPAFLDSPYGVGSTCDDLK